MQRGFVILFEGGDRCGKSTQALRLANYLSSKFPGNVHQQKFPDRETPIGKKIAAYLTNQIFLSKQEVHDSFIENRWEVVKSMVQKINDGSIYILDRYSLSGVAYSAANGNDMKSCMLDEKDLLAPDLVFFMDLDPKIAAKRADYGDEIYEKVPFQSKVYKKFRSLKEIWDTQVSENTGISTQNTSSNFYQHKWHDIDANRNVDDISEEIIGVVNHAIEHFMTNNNPLGRLWDFEPFNPSTHTPLIDFNKTTGERTTAVDAIGDASILSADNKENVDTSEGCQ